jgi:hypothetical protein
MRYGCRGNYLEYPDLPLGVKRRIFQVSLVIRETTGTVSPGGKPSGAVTPV